ncbi:MAG: extracellular solute-binding protein, partial [Thermoflexales bacterium]|nr:extracellular solute-binding protein [Thermoflexales bacterium]
MKKYTFPFIASIIIASMLLASCGGGAPAPTAAPAQPAATVAPTKPAPVKVVWWHISTGEEHKAYWQKLADEYTAAHPNVTIEITVLENEAFKSKLTTVMQSGEP